MMSRPAARSAPLPMKEKLEIYGEPFAAQQSIAAIAGALSAPRGDWSPSFGRTEACAVLKRGFDIVGASLCLLFLLPFLLVVSAAIWLESGGPILFRQRRTGLKGKIFTILKFRTMAVLEDGPQIAHAVLGDARVTRVGRFLRVSSLDELPQLLNILRGQMSFVGPRPHALAHDEHYSALLPHYRERFAVKPGLTGLAQVQGLRGEIRLLDDMASRVDADVAYATYWSFPDDLLILLRTIPVVLAQKNAY